MVNENLTHYVLFLLLLNYINCLLETASSCWLTGGSVDKIEVYSNEGGMCATYSNCILLCHLYCMKYFWSTWLSHCSAKEYSTHAFWLFDGTCAFTSRCDRTRNTQVWRTFGVDSDLRLFPRGMSASLFGVVYSSHWVVHGSVQRSQLVSSCLRY